MDPAPAETPNSPLATEVIHDYFGSKIARFIAILIYCSPTRLAWLFNSHTPTFATYLPPESSPYDAIFFTDRPCSSPSRSA
jgi:hypothetical protein